MKEKNEGIEYTLLNQELQSKSKSRKDKAFERVFNEYADSLTTSAHCRLHDLHTATNVVTDVFKLVYESPEKVKAVKNLERYLRRTVTNRCNSILRKKQSQSIRLCEANSKCSIAKGPDEEAIISEESEMAISALVQLPHKQREVVTRHLIDGWSYQEIADTLGIRPSTVRSQHTRAMKRMRSILSSKIDR